MGIRRPRGDDDTFLLRQLMCVELPLRCSILALATLTLVPLGACSRVACDGDPASITRPAEWTVESHCPGVAPSYGQVFDEQVVHKIDLVISAADHQAALDDMDAKYSGGSPLSDLDALPTPIWFPATVRYNGRTWTQVGMRYKGHASLKGAWQRGVRKLSFILEFDHYEDLDKDLQNQRFYGFKKLAFSNGYNDPSLMREKLAAEIFRAGGVPAARSSFARVQLDWGQGSAYLGLYTIVEDACDTMMKSQVGDASGALYKPWGDAARWLSPAEIGASEIAAKFDTCNSADPPAGDDVIAAITSLHQDRANASSWRARLEQTLDVQSFLRTLAINQTMMNWDSYGCMHHNYFIYANPGNGRRLSWFPWDLNESMLRRTQSGCPAPGSVMLDEIVNGASGVDATWPLIGFLLADTEYRVAYRTYLRGALDSAFAESTVVAKMRQYHDLIAPFVVGPEGVESYPYSNTTQSDFVCSLTTGDSALEPHVTARHQAVEAALAAP
jgi:spore coat protein H